MPSPPKDPPVLRVKWHDLTGWVLDRVESFPKNQRFIFGQRLANHRVDVMELPTSRHVGETLQASGLESHAKGITPRRFIWVSRAGGAPA